MIYSLSDTSLSLAELGALDITIMAGAPLALSLKVHEYAQPYLENMTDRSKKIAGALIFASVDILTTCALAYIASIPYLTALSISISAVVVFGCFSHFSKTQKQQIAAQEHRIATLEGRPLGIEEDSLTPLTVRLTDLEDRPLGIEEDSLTPLTNRLTALEDRPIGIEEDRLTPFTERVAALEGLNAKIDVLNSRITEIKEIKGTLFALTEIITTLSDRIDEEALAET